MRKAEPTGDESASRIDLGLQANTGAPCPHLIQSELRTFLAFYLHERDPNWDGTWVKVIDPATEDELPIGVIEWPDCRGAVLGGPNDEALHGHRLWTRGLEEVGHYRSAIIANSRWIAELERANSVHPNHDPGVYRSLRHYLIAFHDSTFECVAAGYRSYRTRSRMPEVLAELTGCLLDDRRPPPFDRVPSPE